MNRYSLFFAVLVASTFAVRAPQAGEAPGAGTAEARRVTANQAKAAGAGVAASPAAVDPLTLKAVQTIQDFFNKADKRAVPAKAEVKPDAHQAAEAAAAPKEEPRPDAKNLQVLFATIPHPVETHLAAAFDHNAQALLDGLQDAGYLIDSSWIPWTIHRARDDFDDDKKEEKQQEEEDRTPGILLFRSQNPNRDPFAAGVLVFLLSEKPTEGVAYAQVERAVEIMKRSGIDRWAPSPFPPLTAPSPPDTLRILGPTYSGSFASLVPAVELLSRKLPTKRVLIRSGQVTSGDEAARAVGRLADRLRGVKIDFGSASHDFGDSIRVASAALKRMGITQSQTVILGEGESLYGSLFNVQGFKSSLYDSAETKDTADFYSLSFPRDIAGIRAGYEQQGLFESTSSTPTLKRFLNLKSNSESTGDTIPSFGGTATIEAKEAVLFGISEFIKAHELRAAIISATSEEDRLFLTQFLHANNAGVRVVVVGTTRMFLRGSTAQFRGDLMVSDFPMFPQLHDWTGSGTGQASRIFANDEAESIYFAAIDLFDEPRDSGSQYKWYPEYSEPHWGGADQGPQRPPMYVVALGSNATWPLFEGPGSPWILPDAKSSPPCNIGGDCALQMPNRLFSGAKACQRPARPAGAPIEVDRYWKVLFWLLVLATGVYCSFFWYANPVSRDLFASFQPTPLREFWLFKQCIPAVAAGCAFWVMAWTVALPAVVAPAAVKWRMMAIAMTLLAPLFIGAAAVLKAWFKVKLGWNGWMRRSAIVTAAAGVVLLVSVLLRADPPEAGNVGAILSIFREMHWESGLSLTPTLLLFLLGIFVWSSQAANGAAALAVAPPLPSFPGNVRISHHRGRCILDTGCPLPELGVARWLYTILGIVAAIMVVAFFFFKPYSHITTLQSNLTSAAVRLLTDILVAMILLDTCQFIWLWEQLRGLLRALDRMPFKRSFVDIHEFDWRNLWSFTGVSFQSVRGIHAKEIDLLVELGETTEFAFLRGTAARIDLLRKRYNTYPDLNKASLGKFKRDAKTFDEKLKWAGDQIAIWVEDRANAALPVTLPDSVEAMQRVLACQCKGDGGRFSDEAEELARLPETRQKAERFLCLMYIGFIRTIVARLHTLLFSVASVFSLLTLGVAIYPFVPFSALLATGLGILLLIAGAFFTVFSQMDTDPILSRIVDGDDRKLQGNFYFKFAESMALPLLTLGSTLLPGGAGRILDLMQTVFHHSQ